jgi:hypothetical protein
VTYIYLITNCFNKPNNVYIGKTKNISSRKNSHCKTYGKNILFTIIDQVDSYNKNDWAPLEKYWLEQFRQWGFNIVNPNKKGGGGSDKWPEESKIKQSLKYVGREVPWATGRPKGTKYTEEQKQKMRKSRINKWRRSSSISQNIIEEIRTLYNTNNYTKTQLHTQFKLSQDTIRNIVDKRGIYDT